MERHDWIEVKKHVEHVRQPKKEVICRVRARSIPAIHIPCTCNTIMLNFNGILRWLPFAVIYPESDH